MIIFLSPSKTQSEAHNSDYPHYSEPYFLNEASQLNYYLANLSSIDVAKLMDLSEKLADLNVRRYKNFNPPFTLNNSRQAIFTYEGDVYSEIDSVNYNFEDLQFAQKHLRIISGFYGLLRPLDLIQNYRLEMATKLAIDVNKNLYDFWGSKLTNQMNDELALYQKPIVVNLASKEYSNAINQDRLIGKCYNIHFKEYKNGQFKIVGLFAKKARGMMANFIIKNKLLHIEEIKEFTQANYQYMPELSCATEIIFARKET